MSDQKPIHAGHRQRLRERYKSTGSDGFADHELLELLLSYSMVQKDTNPLAHKLIREFGTLRGVLDAEPERLAEVDETGAYCIFLLKLIPDIARRYYEQLSSGYIQFNDNQLNANFFIPRFIGRREECLYAAFLDEKKRLIDCSLQYIGSINAVEIHAAKLLRTAQRLNARHVMIAHNHFIDYTPSSQDIAATREVYVVLRRAGIKLTDHAIVCGSEALSMEESGHFRKVVY